VLVPAFVAYKVVATGAFVATSLWAAATRSAKVAALLWHGVLAAGKAVLAAYRAVVWATAGAMFRLRASMVAQKVAMIAVAAWTKIVTAAQWLWNLAMMANPVGLIIIAIVALVAVIVYLWTHSAGFRDFFIGVWEHIWSFMKMIGAWFAGPFKDFFVNAFLWVMNKVHDVHMFVVGKFNAIVAFVTSLPGRIKAAAKGMWDGIVTAFKGAINWLLSLWNRIDFAINIRVPDWVPGIGGRGFSVPDILPDLPYLEAGGRITRGGAAVVADRNGRGGEVVSLPRGAQVTPLPGGGVARLVIDVRGADAEMKRMVRKMIKDGGGLAATFA
jgi:hypothetical protein